MQFHFVGEMLYCPFETRTEIQTVLKYALFDVYMSSYVENGFKMLCLTIVANNRR